MAQGANIPITEAAEARLHAKGILNLPDFIANAGGVICAAVEYHGGNETLAMQTIADKITANTQAVLRDSAATGIPPRQAALALARRRVAEAMSYRRRF